MYPMPQGSGFGYIINYFIFLGISAWGGIVAWKLARATTHWLLFAFYQWTAQTATVALVLKILVIYLTPSTYDPQVANEEMSDNDMIMLICIFNTFLSACPILLSSYLGSQLYQKQENEQ